MSSQFVPPTACCGHPVTGPMTTMMVTTGCQALGWKRQNRASYGRPAIGAGATVFTSGMPATGVPTWASMVASITDSDTSAWVLAAANGGAALSFTTPRPGT